MDARLLAMDGLVISGFYGHMTTTPHTSVHPTITVIGGTERTGRRVSDRLRSRGLDVRIGSRAGSPSFYWEKPETWASVLHGCAAAYTTDTVEMVVGRPAVDIAAYVRHAAAWAAWSLAESPVEVAS